MPIPFGQRPNPSWDALRVQSLNVFGGTLLDNPPGSGSGLQNKIYVWHANGSSLDEFDLTEAELNAANAAARDGDAITIPAVTIAMTAVITFPIGVTVYGLSRENTILSFTGLSSATAVTLQARGVLEHLTVRVAGTQPLIGIDARAAKATVREVTVYMADNANNIKIYAGWPESA